MLFKSTKFKLLICITHALIMLAIIFFWNDSELSLNSESSFLKVASLIKNNTFLKSLSKNAIQPKDVLFVNTAESGRIITNDDSSRTYITDRKLLSEFLLTVNKLPGKKVILCDLLFSIPSEDDSQLRSVINTTPNIYFPVEDSVQEALQFQNLRGGFTSYNITNNWWKLSSSLNKFKLVDKVGNKSLPLLMAENFFNKKFACKWGLLKSGNKVFFSSVYIDPARQGYSMGNISANKPVIFSMADLLFLKDNFGDSALRDYIRPYIIIGDFDKDIHKIGNDVASGPMILFSIFVGLINGDNKITVLWLLFILVFFTAISYLLFFAAMPEKVRKYHRFVHKLIGKFGDRILTNGVWLLLIAVVSYTFFNKTIEIVVLTLWITMIEYLLDAWNRHKAIKDLKEIPWLIKARHILFNYLDNKIIEE